MDREKFRIGISVSVSGNVACRLRSTNEGNIHTFSGTFPVIEEVIYNIYLLLVLITIVIFSYIPIQNFCCGWYNS